MRLIADKIVNETDDILGRKEFATDISKGIQAYTKKYTDGITISVTGEWGSGKSTLLHYIKNQLVTESSKGYKIIDFNPWIFYKEGNIREAFLIHFALELKGSGSTITSVSKKIKLFISAFRFLKNINGVAGNIQDGLEKTFEFFASNDNISELKNEIEKLLIKSKRKIIVFIDDVDRLSQDEILQLFQTISLVANFSNVHYIIAFDKEIVLSAIEKEYNGHGPEYLEKIIQVDYPLPMIRKEKLENLFFQELHTLFTDLKINIDLVPLKTIWLYCGLSDFFTTIRDYKRFFNSLNFRLPSIVNDININDFITIEAIRLFDNDGYNNFYRIYSTNIRKREISEKGMTDEQFKRFKPNTADLLKSLLQKSSLDWLKTDLNSKRIYDPNYFDRYFSLLRNDGDISEKDFNEFMERPLARHKILNEAVAYQRIQNLLQRLGDDAISKHFPNYSYSVIEALINFFGSHLREFENYHHMVSEAIINLLCASKHRSEYINDFFLSFKNYTLNHNFVFIYFYYFIRLHKKQNRGFRGKSQEFNDYLLNNFEQINRWYIEAFHRSALTLFEHKYTIECPYIKYLCILNFAEIFPVEYLKIQPEIMKDTKFIMFLLSKFISLNENLTAERYDLATKDLIFPNDTFILFYNSIKDLNPLELNEFEKAFVNSFLKIDTSKLPEIEIHD